MEIDQETDHIGYYKANGCFEGYYGSIFQGHSILQILNLCKSHKDTVSVRVFNLLIN